MLTKCKEEKKQLIKILSKKKDFIWEMVLISSQIYLIHDTCS